MLGRLSFIGQVSIEQAAVRVRRVKRSPAGVFYFFVLHGDSGMVVVAGNSGCDVPLPPCRRDGTGLTCDGGSGADDVEY